jgi:hypothetical protein
MMDILSDRKRNAAFCQGKMCGSLTEKLKTEENSLE